MGDLASLLRATGGFEGRVAQPNPELAPAREKLVALLFERWDPEEGARRTDTSVDASKWLVFRNTGTGFSATASSFALPPGYTAFYGAYGESGYCDSRNVPAHSLVDMDGDGKPDLLVTSSCTDTSVDTSKWLVFRNTGTGFSATASSFALPPGYTNFYGVSNASGYCDSRNVPAHALTDVDGDGKPDLLVTSSCTDTSVDTDKWLLFRNSGTGFSQTAASFALPSGYTTFYGIDNATGYRDSRNVPGHALIDVDGDRKPDLLITSSCTDTSVDATKWLLHRNTGTGFAATASTFALPPGYTTFYGIGDESGYCDSRNVPAHALMDMDGDGKPDLLVTSSCSDTSIDQSKWLLFAGTGSGFAQTSTNVALPVGYTAFYGTAGAVTAGYCDSRNVPAHVVTDLDGDGRPDILITSACNDATVDKDKWLLSRSVCAK